MNPTASNSSFISLTQDDDIFFYLINEGNEKEIKDILSDDKKKNNIWDYRNPESQNSSVLHLAVYKKNKNITIQIIDYCKKKLAPEKLKIFINQENDQGVTAIHYASFRGEVQIIKLLIENGAEINKKTKRGLNVIHYAAQGNKSSSLMYFYRNHLEKLNFKEVDNGGSTPLHWASYSSSVEVLLYILNLNIFDDEFDKENFINNQDKEGFTSLHLAILSKSLKVVMKLLQNGASTKIKNKKNQTPYDLAIEKKANDIAEKLLNSEGCQLCAFKAPVKKIKKSRSNIYLVISSQIISLLILLISIFPRFKNDIIFYIHFESYCAFLLVFFILYIYLINCNPGEIHGINLEKLDEIIDKGENLNNYCPKCLVKKKRNSEHCIVCNKCYDDFDHHCYWINNCVAKRNYSIFILFLFIALILLLIILSSGIFGLIYGIRDGFNVTNNFLRVIFFDKSLMNIILNIGLIVLNLSFLIPEMMLVILHMYVISYNKKHRKRNNSRSKTLSVGEPLIAENSEG